ncbi:apoptosis regulatory protein Siva-like [Tubulanus polymorphus]|uniref:apoptosis regulatory protein Siva-like n=1 Tax=Tubulanus polymorphus TaxID=672921 RepID=UPI003DA5F8F8
MPKRRNPWENSSPLQLKTRIGFKEIASGVNGDHYMKAVYEKTKELLFAGARKESTTCPTSSIDFGEYGGGGGSIEHLLDEPIPVGQTALDKNGCVIGRIDYNELSNVMDHHVMDCVSDSQMSSQGSTGSQSTLNMYGFFKSAPAVTSTPHPSPAKGCQCCGKNTARPVLKCGFCSRKICLDCHRTCNSCQQGFCSLCSTINYNNSMEQIFCLNCFS